MKVGEVEEKITNIEDGEFTDKMIDAVKSITRDQNKEIKTIVEKKTMEQREVNKKMVLEIVGEEKRKMESELEERMKRKTNLIIFGLEEDTTEKDAGIKKDRAAIETILGEIKVSHKPINSRRLGNLPTENLATGSEMGRGKRTRPLRLIFASEVARDETLRSFHRTRKEKVTEEEDTRLISKVSMRMDMTPKEREEDEALYQHLIKKREISKNEGDEHAIWIRRKGQVINIGKYPVDKGPREAKKKE
ncbi:hypothetical protein EGW08_001323 [Elysia chlorotica]|uniref:L1 transposable element RRM domain-containing protein n=1 Tax=Elysia chlorotica TaxID=188477 RepID=A0A3S1A000_ELYCH|nr:hypothetical protein EGW08_001323 [Elysia chlorotica]